MNDRTFSSRFFQNRACEFFPCHQGMPAEDFNCLFCYCPLYALGKQCGGNPKYLSNGVKSCEDCLFPHQPDNYDRLLARYSEILEIVKRSDAVNREPS